MYLLDTCVLSETRKKRPDPKVIDWLSRQDPNLLFLSAISIGEIRNGIASLGQTRKARELSGWLTELEKAFAPRILSVNLTVAECWGETLAAAAKEGFPRPPIDALIAACAKVDNMTLVTRNVEDMSHMGIKIYNPFAQ